MKDDKTPILGSENEELQNSTIFSKPQIEHKKAPKKGKKNISVWLLVAFVPLLIAGLVFGISSLKDNVIPNKDESTSSAEPQTITINVTENALSNVESVVLENENGKFEFYSKASSVNSDENEAYDDLWYLKGVDKEYTDTEFTGLTVKDCATFVANEKYESKEVSFDNPSAKIKVNLKKGEDYEIIISELLGKDSKLGGAYAKVTGDSNVYFLKQEFVEYFTRDQKYYIDYVAPTAIEKTEDTSKYFGEGLESFDYIEISGRDVKNTYRFEMYEKDSTTKYKMVSPYFVKVKTAALKDIVSLLETDLDNTGIMGILHYDPKGIDDKTIKKFGFDNPSATIEYKVGNQTKRIILRDIQAADPKSENYEYSMMVEGVPVIYEVTKANFDYFGFDISEFATDNVIEEDISEVKTFSFLIDSKEYIFNLSQKELEDNNAELSVKYDGKSINAENFIEFYDFAKAIKPFISSLCFERPDNALEYFKINIKNMDKKAPETELKVFKLKGNSARCYLELDGNPVGTCDMAKAEKLATNILNLIKNKELK